MAPGESIHRLGVSTEAPGIIGEFDPEGCAACSARLYPQNANRNGTMYPCYTAATLRNILELVERYSARLEGVVTWAFELEDQPWFDGFRTLASNGVAKPVLNVFRMFGLMRGDTLKVESTGAVALDIILQNGVMILFLSYRCRIDKR